MSSHMAGRSFPERSLCCHGGPPHTSRHHGDESGKSRRLRPVSGHQNGRPGSRITPQLDAQGSAVTQCQYELCRYLELTYLCPGSGAGPWCHHRQEAEGGPRCRHKLQSHLIRAEEAELGSPDLRIAEEIFFEWPEGVHVCPIRPQGAGLRNRVEFKCSIEMPQ